MHAVPVHHLSLLLLLGSCQILVSHPRCVVLLQLGTPDGTGTLFTNWGCTLFSYFYAAVADNYTFSIGSNDGTQVFVNGQLVISNTGNLSLWS